MPVYTLYSVLSACLFLIISRDLNPAITEATRRHDFDGSKEYGNLKEFTIK
jgi:hypothetical protein